MKKRFLTSAVTVAVVLLFAAGVVSMAAAGRPGSAEDPLVSLSYLNDVVTKQITDKMTKEIDDKLALLETELGSRGVAPGVTVEPQEKFAVITINSGQKITFSIGAEIIHRIGSVKCIADSSPGLIDATDGSTLDNGKVLINNHLYLVTIEGRGIQADGAATLLIKGSYTTN